MSFVAFFFSLNVLHAQILDMSGRTATVKDLQSSQTLSVNGQNESLVPLRNPVLIEPASGVPIIVVPAGSAATFKPPVLPMDSSWLAGRKEFQQELDRALFTILEIQEKAKRKNLGAATQALSELRERFPGSSAVDWIEANVLVLSGKRLEAIEKLQAILKRDSSNTQAKQLLNQLNTSGDAR